MRGRCNGFFRLHSISSALILSALLLSAPFFAATAQAKGSNFELTSSPAPATVNPGQSVTITAEATATDAASGIDINFSVYNSKGDYLGQQGFKNLNLNAGQTITQNFVWAVPAKTAAGKYSVHVDMWQYSSSGSRTFIVSAPTSFTVSTTTTTPQVCTDFSGATHASGSTYTLTLSKTSGSIAATTAQCPYSGTQATTTTVTQSYLCTNGTQTAQGSSISTTADSGSPVCKAAAACGSTPSGQTVTQTISTTSGSIAATAAQCPSGGTQPTKTTVTQVQLCINGTLSNQGAQVSMTVNNGSPICNVQTSVACTDANGASHASGSTYTVTTTSSGSIAATAAQCPNGGTQATTVATAQSYMCTNGTQTAQGSATITTTDKGSPSCNAPAAVNGACGSASGIPVASAPASNLCSTGTASTVTGTASFAWSCAGSNGGTTASCSAPAVTVSQAVNGQCGAANGVGTNAAPTSGLCTVGTASTLSGNGPWTWSCAGSNGGTNASCSDTLVSSTGGNCAYAANGFADGCANAAAGVVPFPSMLSAYKVRPSWDVAGVDYYVGVPSNVTLKDPTTAALPSGCSFSKTSVTCSGSNAIVLNGYDFSLHNGTVLNISAANITVENSLFVVGSNMGALGTAINITSAAGNVSLINNEVNGNNIGVTVQAGQTINIANVGNITIEYNYFHNSGGDMIDFGGGPQVQTIKYNVWKDIGLITAHSDTIQWCRSVITSADISFNVFDQTKSGLSGEGLLEPNSECSGASMNNLLSHNNTLISLVQDNFGVGQDVTQDAGTATGSNISVFDNFIDPTGIDNYTNSPWFPTGSYGSTLAQPSSMYGLTNMVTGAAIPMPTKSKPSGGYYVYPDAAGFSPSLIDEQSIAASPASGTVGAGSTLSITLSMDEPWNVTGSPTLTLNDGGVATYASGSGTNALVFTQAVGSSSTSVSSLAVTGFNLNGGTIKDNFGNAVNLAGLTATFSGLAISSTGTSSGGTGTGNPGTATNGVCGSANGATVAVAPASGFCTTGTASAVSGSGPFNWTCAGSNGGTTASCMASLATVQPSTVNGACGTSNGLSTSTKPTAGLCTTGTATTVAGSGPFTWACDGSNGGTNASCSTTLTVTTGAGTTNGNWPGQSGNPVGYEAYAPLGTTPWTGGSFKSGTASNPTIYRGYVFTGSQNISGSYIEFISCDFNSGTGGVNVTGSNITFIGDRFQSNSSPNYNVQTTGTNLVFQYDSFTPLASLYTAPPGAAWPSAGAGMNTTTQVADVNSINGNSGYQYGLSINAGGPVTVDHSDFWGFGNDGVQWMGTSAQMTITNNWMHDAANASPQGYHIDGLGYVNGTAGPSNILIQGNTIASLGNTNAIAFQAATSGYSNIQIVGNYISGFGYTMDGGQPGNTPFKNSTFVDNVYGTDVMPVWGPLYGWTTGGGNVWKCNKLNIVPGTNYTDGGDNWKPVAADNGLYWLPTSSIASTTDYLGNTTCP